MVIVKSDEKMLEASLWKQVPEACRESSQRVVPFWRAHYPTPEPPEPGGGRTHSLLTWFLSPLRPSQPWAKAKMKILFALHGPPAPLQHPSPFCVRLSPSGPARFWEASFTTGVNLNLWITSCRAISIYILSLTPVTGIPDLQEDFFVVVVFVIVICYHSHPPPRGSFTLKIHPSRRLPSSPGKKWLQQETLGSSGPVHLASCLDPPSSLSSSEDMGTLIFIKVNCGMKEIFW